MFAALPVSHTLCVLRCGWWHWVCGMLCAQCICMDGMPHRTSRDMVVLCRVVNDNRALTLIEPGAFANLTLANLCVCATLRDLAVITRQLFHGCDCTTMARAATRTYHTDSSTAGTWWRWGT